jgi:hypothetical protein
MIPRLALFCFVLLGLCTIILAQTTTIIPVNEAAAHINEWATVEGFVAKALLGATLVMVPTL